MKRSQSCDEKEKRGNRALEETCLPVWMEERKSMLGVVRVEGKRVGESFVERGGNI